MVDYLKDIKLDEDRTISVGGDGDLETTSGEDTVEQSVAIGVGGAIRSLIGEPLSAAVYEDVQSEIEDALRSDPQIDSVSRVDITEINKADGSVTVEVHSSLNESFELNINT